MTTFKLTAASLITAAFINAAGFAATQDAQVREDVAKAVSPAAEQAPAAQDELPPKWYETESLFLEAVTPPALSDNGFTPILSWTGELWSNMGGGMERGTIWDSLFTVGFEQDFSKLFKKDNLGALGLNFFYYADAKGFDNYLSGYSSPSNIMSGHMTRFFEIFYANEFEVGDGALGFRVGQLAADEDFMGMDYSDVFLNSNFGAMPAIAGTNLVGGERVAFSQYALATLGLVTYYNLNDFQAKIGVYNGDAGRDISSNHGFDYELQGVALWYQLTQKYVVCGREGMAVFGGNYHSGKFENNYTGNSERNYYSFFLNFQQDFLLNAEGEKVLGGFVRLGWAPNEDIAEFTKYADFGLNWFAPIAGRSDDIAAVGVSIMERGAGARSKARAAGEDDRRWETCIEFTYKAQVTPAISLQPVLQLYFNPTSDNGDDRTAIVGGARVEVNF